jgi:hypothetical protein
MWQGQERPDHFRLFFNGVEAVSTLLFDDKRRERFAARRSM